MIIIADEINELSFFKKWNSEKANSAGSSNESNGARWRMWAQSSEKRSPALARISDKKRDKTDILNSSYT